MHGKLSLNFSFFATCLGVIQRLHVYVLACGIDILTLTTVVRTSCVDIRKPILSQAYSIYSLAFNISHSSCLSVCVVSGARRVIKDIFHLLKQTWNIYHVRSFTRGQCLMIIFTSTVLLNTQMLCIQGRIHTSSNSFWRLVHFH